MVKWLCTFCKKHEIWHRPSLGLNKRFQSGSPKKICLFCPFLGHFRGPPFPTSLHPRSPTGWTVDVCKNGRPGWLVGETQVEHARRSDGIQWHAGMACLFSLFPDFSQLYLFEGVFKESHEIQGVFKEFDSSVRTLLNVVYVVLCVET